MTDLNHLYSSVLKANPGAVDNRNLARKLFREAVLSGKWVNTAIDLAFNVVEASVKSEELQAQRDIREAEWARKRPKTVAPKLDPEQVRNDARQAREQFAQREQSERTKGASRFEAAKAEIEQIRFANGLGILKQTVADIQKFGGWMAAVLCALPKHAKTTDEIGKYLTLDKLVKIRTFETAHAA